MQIHLATELMTSMCNHHVGRGQDVSDRQFKSMFGVSPLVSGLLLKTLIHIKGSYPAVQGITNGELSCE